MGDFNTRISYGTYQYCDGSNTTFIGSEMRYSNSNGYVGVGGYIASDDLENPYGLFDLKGKLNYDSDGIFEQNVRVRTAFGDDRKTTQIRYSPLTVNVPITKNLNLYSNTHYSGKYNYETQEWGHSIGNFTGVSYDIGKKDNISLEAQRYNLQNIKDNSSNNWGINFVYTHKF